MIRQDEDGRYPLSVPEYQTLQFLYGYVNELANGGILEERLKTIPGGWRDYNMLAVRSGNLFGELVKTAPRNKVQQLKNEMRGAYARVEVKKPARIEGDVAVVDKKALWALIDRCMNMDCMFCQKSKVEGKKCEIYKTVMDCLPYEFRGDGKSCPLAGSSELRKDETA